MLLSLLLSALAAPGDPFPQEPVADGLARAAAAERPLVVWFHANWSPASRRLAQELPGLEQWIGERAETLQVDVEADPSVGDAHRVSGLPTIVVLAPDGEEQGRVCGYGELEALGDELAAVFRGRAYLPEPPTRRRGDPEALARHLEAERLAACGAGEAALEIYRWCWEEAAEKDGTYLSYRLEALPQAMVLLGRSYAPAREAVLELRAGLEAPLVQGAGDWRVARDFAALESALGDLAHGLEVFDAAVEAGASERVEETLFDLVLGELVARGRYRDVLDGAPRVRFRLKNLIGAAHAFLGRPFEAEARGRVLREGRWFVRAFLEVGEEEEAEKTADVLLRFDSTPATFAGLAAEGRAAGAEAFTARILERAAEVLGEEALGALGAGAR